MDNYDKYKTQESPAMSAEDLDAQAERDEAAKLEGLRQVAENFCDHVNTKTYFGDWYAEIVEGKVLVINDVSDAATHEFEVINGCPCAHRGARAENWFTNALAGHMEDFAHHAAEVQAKKAAMKGGVK